MFYPTLVLLLGMLGATIYRALRIKQPVAIAFGWIGGFSLIALCFGSTPTWELGFILFVSIVIVDAINRRKLFIPISLAAFALVIGVNSWFAWRGVERVREEYPIESLEARLPERLQKDNSPVLKSTKAIDEQETLVGRYADDARARADALKRIHERAVFVFINQPNFGVLRGMSVIEWGLKLGLREDKSIVQPGTRSLSTEMLEQIGKPMTADPDFSTMHILGAVDFIHPRGFGYIEDCRHVAGFQSHQFSEVPDAGKKWKLQALDLVGLVVHEKPVVYMSDHLPRMDELRQAPMRELNAFESAGLKALQAGDDIFVREMPDQSVRMLGALRAMKQCIDCHGGARGDLLGAFSYELRKD